MSSEAPVDTSEQLPRLILTVEQARHMLSISTAHIYRLMESGELRSFKCGRLRRLALADVQDYVERQRQRAAEEGWG